MPRSPWGSPTTIRSRVVLEMAADLVSDYDFPYLQAKVLLREQASGGEWPLQLFGSSGMEGIQEVANGQAALGTLNPANFLMLAHRGLPPFSTPQPVSVLTMLPSEDQCVLAVRPGLDMESIEDLATKKMPLKISLRGQDGHSTHYIFDGILAACGTSVDDIVRWGGEVRREGLLPWADGPRFKALVEGKIDALFDEAVPLWMNEALAAGLRLVPLSDKMAKTLAQAGYRIGHVKRSQFTALESDVLSVDYSGWPIFVKSDLSDELVMKMCASLEARRHLIPWEGDGPLPLERMCNEGPDTPQLVPLHPGAERFWKQRGYL